MLASICQLGQAKWVDQTPTCETALQKQPPDPDVVAPTDSMLTPYDHEHMVTYFRLLDPDAEGADW